MGRRKDKSDIPPAPGELLIVQAFLNTVDRGLGTDELASPQALADWLTRHRLLTTACELTAADLERAITVREGLRTRLAGTDDGDRSADLDRVMAAVPVHARFGPGAIVRLEPLADGLDGALGRLLAAVTAAQVEGRWPRFKVCACGAAFYDRSSNSAGKWCRPRCGNRWSARVSRRRRRGDDARS